MLGDVPESEYEIPQLYEDWLMEFSEEVID